MKKISLTEAELTKIIQKVIKEDAGMDTPGGNPEYFYDDDWKNLKKQYGGNYSKDSDDGAIYSKDSEEGAIYTKEDVVDDLTAIYSYSQDGATDLVNSSLENLLYKLGGFK
jgi:hypothetical protein